MLDSVTKKRIDNLRNILVGKIPSPQSQVEQITTGLIYKFMYDMDHEAIEMGVVPSFFVDEYEKYSWNHLFNPKLGGVEKVKLYSDAIENLYNNPHAPSMFREIFKNSFLPFKDPSTLNMFLKEINEFQYSNSEKLGDAYEYLLSFMGSQGDAGQFRTPRHIIDFIIDIINPQKYEKILDPACGSSGFLISSYKHILKQNSQKRIGDQLNASERKQIGENLVGYDIDPAMTRISLVNMYLHNFASPKISEYDTLSSEEKWQEYFDVILANPPFFSPTGGIKPHSRFGVKSTRAEVLFVDYIIEHLKPNGRAGIIVPEGIIFQTGIAYKKLRKKLIEDCLIGVISLPSGVFQPYSGVKTSIIILDKQLNQKHESIFFAKVEHDGFSLGAQRTPTLSNDLPAIIADFSEFINSKQLSISNTVEKYDLLKQDDISLSVSRYIQSSAINTEYDVVPLGDVCSFQGGSQPPKSVFAYEPLEGYDRFIQIRDFNDNQNLTFIPKSNKNKYCKSDDVLIGRYGASVGKICRGLAGAYNVALIKTIPSHEKLLKNYLYYILCSKKMQNFIISMSERAAQAGVNPEHLKDYLIPIPPLKIQQEIVEEIEGYQKIINGCKQVIENYKPSFEIDPYWEMVELGKLAYLKYGLGESAVDEGTHRFIRITDINEFGLLRSDEKKYASIDKSKEEYLLKKNDILIARTGATYGKCLYFEDNEPSIFAGYLIKVSLNERVIPKFFWIFSQSNNFDIQKKQLVVGGGQPQFNANTLKKLLVPVPPIHKQEEIIEEVLNHQKIVKGNINLMNHFQNKITEKINKIFGK